jgi:hypothetical protein
MILFRLDYSSDWILSEMYDVESKTSRSKRISIVSEAAKDCTGSYSVIPRPRTPRPHRKIDKAVVTYSQPGAPLVINYPCYIYDTKRITTLFKGFKCK